jgi:hypothetical protein
MTWDFFFAFLLHDQAAPGKGSLETKSEDSAKKKREREKKGGADGFEHYTTDCCFWLL